jgi:hypothetical protein
MTGRGDKSSTYMQIEELDALLAQIRTPDALVDDLVLAVKEHGLGVLDELEERAKHQEHVALTLMTAAIPSAPIDSVRAAGNETVGL